VAFLKPEEMVSADPLPGWHGRFFHSENMTFSHYDIDSDAAPLHEHHHEQEEVWHIVGGEVMITVDGVEQRVGDGGVVVVPGNAPHSVRPIGAARVVVADYPLRERIPGVGRLI
jgi:mannose-6-phosphate isomerase-like protein (cupin superfamily)